MTTPSARRLYAWETNDPSDLVLEPAPSERAWMNETDRRFAYRCLPLVMANQAGWIVRCPVSFTVRWNGGRRPTDLRLWFPRRRKDPRICSHFGEGVLTFSISCLFQTPPGINLWVKGPSNWIKDGIQALEGLVETDWSEATFTMNWKLTRPGHSVRFEEGEPFCMLVPLPRDLAESLDPVRRPLYKDPELFRRHERWRAGRAEFNAALRQLEPEAVKQGWQRDYMLGRDSAGRTFANHQTKLNLRPFRRG